MGVFNVGRECGVTPIIPPAMPPQQPLATPSLAKQPSNSTLIHTKPVHGQVKSVETWSSTFSTLFQS